MVVTSRRVPSLARGAARFQPRVAGRVRRWPLVAAFLLLAGTAEARERPARIVIYNGIGTVASARLWGRVLEDPGKGAPTAGESKWRKLKRSLSELESDEIAHASLSIEVLGKKHPLKADGEGLFQLDLKGPLPVGEHEVSATLAGKRPFSVEKGRLRVVPAAPGIAILSDIDDTVLQTGVTDKAKMLKKVLFSNAHDLQTYPGAAALYQVWQRRGYPIVFVSGSPVNLYSRLQQFFALRGFPPAPLLLKNLGGGKGSDSLFDQKGYKLRRILEVQALLPGYRFILVGDTGEKDPEIYSIIRDRDRKRVVEILIHRVTKEAASLGRFHGERVFDSYLELARLLHKSRALDKKELDAIEAAAGPARPGVAR
jgi:phosphatidate phosphatase APP1